MYLKKNNASRNLRFTQATLHAGCASRVLRFRYFAISCTVYINLFSLIYFIYCYLWVGVYSVNCVSKEYILKTTLQETNTSRDLRFTRATLQIFALPCPDYINLFSLFHFIYYYYWVWLCYAYCVSKKTKTKNASRNLRFTRPTLHTKLQIFCNGIYYFHAIPCPSPRDK